MRLMAFWILASALLVACGIPPSSTPEQLADTSPSTSTIAMPESWRYRDAVPMASGQYGMVVTDAPLATRVGVQVLRDGGSAVDAAVAVAFALAVVWPEAGNIGGGGFALVHVDGQTSALDFRETAPAASRRDMFLDVNGDATDASVTGHLAVAVPGSVAGLWELHRKFGTRPWSELLAPSIELAQRGFSIDVDVTRGIAGEGDRLARHAESLRLFLPGGTPLLTDSIWANPDLATVLALISAHGRDGFYAGVVAQGVIEEMNRGAGIVTLQDLVDYQPKWREPIEFTYRGQRVATMPLPSSGGLALAMIAQQLESYDLAALGWQSAASIHLQTEAMRRAFAIRNERLGDPDFIAVDVASLSSKEFARLLQASIATDRATPSEEIAVAAGAEQQGRHTTHFSVADRFGNAVALTTTLNSAFGSAVTVHGLGFVLNNEMDDFTVKPGAPNQFGLVQSSANAIAPGKRMLSSMTPTIVFAPDGRPILVTGASGGPHIITTVFHMVSGMIDHGLDIGTTMRAPRIHHQHLPDTLMLERHGFTRPTVAALEQLGHQTGFFDVPTPDWSIAATIGWRNGNWIGVADPRIHGHAGGVDALRSKSELSAPRVP